MKCATCKFWTGNRTDPAQGQCRRFPPATAGNVVMQGPGTIANPQGQPTPVPIYTTPTTPGDHWCGEWSVVLAL